MSRSSRPSILVVLAVLTAPFAAPQALLAAPPAPESLEAWVPEDVIGYLKLDGLGEKLEAFLASDLRKEIESLSLVRMAKAHPNWGKLEDAIEDAREATGKDPLALFRELLGAEVVVGVRLGFGPEVLLITRARGEKELEEGIKTLRSAALKRLGHLPSPQESRHRDRLIESYDQIHTTRMGAIFAISNSQAFLEKVIDLSAGESKASLKASTLFQKAAAAAKGSLASLAVRPQFIPNFRIPEKADNAVGSLLAGGFLGALEGSQLLTAALTQKGESLALEVSSVLGPNGLAEKYRAFFPEVASDGLAARLEKRGVLVMGQLHRDLAKWWERREELLHSNGVGELQNFSTIMSILFGGRSFQDEVLPEFGPTITLVARNQEYAGLPEKPKPAIPAFAGILELKGAERFGNNLVAGFQTLVGIMNADAAQKKKEGAMAMVLKTEKVGEVELHTVALNLPKEARPGMAWNFTPSLALVGPRVVISSSQELAKVLVEELKDVKPAGTTSASRSSDSLVVEAGAVRSILELNRDLIVADNMLKKGVGKPEAEGEIDGILEVIKKLQHLRLEAKKDGESVKMRLELRVRAGSAPAATDRKKEVSL